MTVTGKTSVLNIWEINKSDDRYTIRDIASCLIHFEAYFKSTKDFCPMENAEILTDDKKRVRVQSSKDLLKMFPKFNQRQFANTCIVTVDELWVHYFQPVRTVGNKIWLTNYS